MGEGGHWVALLNQKGRIGLAGTIQTLEKHTRQNAPRQKKSTLSALYKFFFLNQEVLAN